MVFAESPRIVMGDPLQSLLLWQEQVVDGPRRALLETRPSVLLCCLFLTIQVSLIEATKIADIWSRLLCQSPK